MARRRPGQDYLGALWAVGLRTRAATETDVERAVAERSIVRTWPMRGTVHFVAAEDARWMLALLAPRVIASRVARYRELGLDDAAFGTSRDAVARALDGGRRLGRDALYRVLGQEGVSTDGQRGIHVLARLAQEQLICFAARDGKQQTFALLDEWLPPAKALAELATRYFTGHGPATFQDLAWWSGLSAADAREALELARPKLVRDSVAGRVLWRAAAPPAGTRAWPAAHLLPAFDELLVGYRDRSATLDAAFAARVRRDVDAQAAEGRGRRDVHVVRAPVPRRASRARGGCGALREVPREARGARGAARGRAPMSLILRRAGLHPEHSPVVAVRIVEAALVHEPVVRGFDPVARPSERLLVPSETGPTSSWQRRELIGACRACPPRRGERLLAPLNGWCHPVVVGQRVALSRVAFSRAPPTAGCPGVATIADVG